MHAHTGADFDSDPILSTPTIRFDRKPKPDSGIKQAVRSQQPKSEKQTESKPSTLKGQLASKPAMSTLTPAMKDFRRALNRQNSKKRRRQQEANDMKLDHAGLTHLMSRPHDPRDYQPPTGYYSMIYE